MVVTWERQDIPERAYRSCIWQKDQTKGWRGQTRAKGNRTPAQRWAQGDNGGAWYGRVLHDTVDSECQRRQAAGVERLGGRLGYF